MKIYKDTFKAYLKPDFYTKTKTISQLGTWMYGASPHPSINAWALARGTTNQINLEKNIFRVDEPYFLRFEDENDYRKYVSEMAHTLLPSLPPYKPQSQWGR